MLDRPLKAIRDVWNRNAQWKSLDNDDHVPLRCAAMKTSLDCVPCLLRQALEAARLVSPDPLLHERVMREALSWAGGMDLAQPPPVMAQRIHRRLREMTGSKDPYRAAKAAQNRVALELLPALRADVRSSDSPLMAAARITIAGNCIDMGVPGNVTEAELHRTMREALTGPFFGEPERFCRAVADARSILYLADNAGEIAFDRLLIEQIGSERVTLVVRGGPVINDATRHDARAVGMDAIVEILDNGSDAPGTLLPDCSPEFRRRFDEADLVLAKGQGNFESLSDQPGNLFFLFKVKCSMVAEQIGQAVGTQVLTVPPKPSRR